MRTQANSKRNTSATEHARRQGESALHANNHTHEANIMHSAYTNAFQAVAIFTSQGKDTQSLQNVHGVKA
jgi:hypothetical protein